MTGTADRRLWTTAGTLLIAYIALTFVGVSFEHSLMLGDKPSKAAAALVDSSMTKNFTGGYIEYLATLLFLVGGLLVAKLLRGSGIAGSWLSSCMTAAVTCQVAVTVAVGFAAGAAAVYDGHHGASLATVTTVNDIRNFSFFMSAGLFAVFAIAASVSVLTTGLLGRWVAYTGLAVGALSVATIPAARTGFINVSTILGLAWTLALGVAAIGRARRTQPGLASQPAATAA